MGIGNRIKEARERLGLTQTELGDMVGVTGSAITNYEKETSHPKEQVIYKLMKTLDVDANYLFQDMVKPKDYQNDISPSEIEIIKKYRKLDERGKATVLNVLGSEYFRTLYSYDFVEKEVNGESVLVAEHNTNKEIKYYILNAAHKRSDITVSKNTNTSEDDIMDDENF